MPCYRKSIYLVLLTALLLFGTFVHAFADEEDRGGIEPLAELAEINVSITGDSFEYFRDEGLLIIKGNVEVTSSDFVIFCDNLEVISDGREKPVIRAYPSVHMVYGDGLAEFNGGDFTYDFNTREGGFGKVEGVVHLNPDNVDIEIDVPLDIRFKANAVRLTSKRLVLDRPWMNIGRGEKSNLSFYSLEIAVDIDGDRITAAEIDRLVVRIFGLKITLLPVRLRQGFEKKSDIGMTGYLPSLSYDADDGVGINQLFFYTFQATSSDESYLSFRLNPYIPDRFYWEVGLNHSFPNGRIGLFYGPLRMEDPFDESQVVWGEPDFRLNYELPRIGDFNHDLRVYWGWIREASREVESERKGFEYSFKLKPAEFGNWSLGVGGAFRMNFYRGGDDYRVFERTVSLMYDGGPDFDTKVSYICNDDDGVSPFLYDKVEVREGVRLRGQAFVNDRWGIASDLLYDLDTDNFDRFGFGPIYVFESMQLGVIYDFEDRILRILVGLPKQFM